MSVFVAMLRGVNVGGHNKIKMDALRLLCESLKLRDVQTHIQSGNVIFRSEERDADVLSRRIQKRIESLFGFRPEVILRTPAELKSVIARNPFTKRRNINPKSLLITFLAGSPSAEGCEKLLSLETAPDELRVDGRELYTYYPSGMARPKVPWATIERILKVSGTGRNWITVNKLLEIAEKIESSS